MIAVMLADGFEELEALTPVDILRRNNFDVKTVAIGNTLEVVGAHGICVKADVLFSNIELKSIDHVIFPGGMPGAKNLDSFAHTTDIIENVEKKGGLICAICASPMILGKRGYLKGKEAVCFPGFEEFLLGAKVGNSNAVSDGNIITGNGMPSSMEFANLIVEKLESRKR